MSRYGVYLPIPIIAVLLAYFYGRSVHRGWLSAILTFCLVMLGGWLHSAPGQIVGVILSALIIFLAFALPEHKRQAHEELRREREAERLPNEEDV